jgi:hypothetical protein
MTPAEIAARSRASQGFAAKVEDEAVLLQVAGMVLAAAGQTREGGDRAPSAP